MESAIALSTGSINCSQAAETIKSADCAIGKTAPEIIFVDRICQQLAATELEI
ncbi:hypothetical protein QUB05_17190 [Microcoleus sp. F10-C6]|uniref:hypothetical protein n=1 Tax=unclassified Microcoleus TaxID=2642155 RepID=UPI002FCF9F32